MYLPIILEDIEVLATFSSDSVPSEFTSRESCSWIYFTDSRPARRKPLIIEVGWIFCFTSSLPSWKSVERRTDNTGGIYLQKFGSNNDNACCSVSYFLIL